MLDPVRIAGATTPALAVVSVKDPFWADVPRPHAAGRGARLVEVPRGDHADIVLAPELVTEIRELVMPR